MTARSVARAFAEFAIVGSGLARVARRRLRGRAVVLAYHNIVPAGEQRAGEASLHLPQDLFARHLDLIARTHEVVPLQSILDEDPDTTLPRVAITFDDAYLGAISAGFKELRQRAMPATVFVAPGLLGSVTWWDCVAQACGGVIPADVRSHAIDELNGDRDRVLEWFAARNPNVGKSSAELPRIASDSELERAAQIPGMTFGAHAWSHRRLSALPLDQLQAELTDSLRWLQARFANTIDWMAYPYGLTSPAVEKAAERANYRGALLVSGGWTNRGLEHPHAFPRLSVPAGLSENGLRLRLAGILSNK